LVAANGSQISTWGKRKISLCLGQGRSFKQDFYIADVTQPILGADFFRANHLAIDLSSKRLIDMENFSAIPTKTVCTPSSTAGIHMASTNNFFDRVIVSSHPTKTSMVWNITS
jgi:hypothetical protein